MAHVLTNASGTTAETFRIGKGGPTILKGTTLPSNALGQNGDLYIRYGGEQGGLFYKSNHLWRSSGEFAEEATGCEIVPGGAIRTLAASTSVALVERPITYDSTEITVDQDDIGFGPTLLTLPPGREGGTLVVKDLGGASTVAIYLLPQGDATIDGSASRALTTDLASLSLVFAGGHWRVIGST